MTREDKSLLLKDLCARLPYMPLLESSNKEVYKYLVLDVSDIRIMMYPEYGEEDIILRPYLRPMSSMTDVEREEWCNVKFEAIMAILRKCEEGSNIANASSDIVSLNWLYERHFDCNNLIERGLAIEAPEGMYKTE